MHHPELFSRKVQDDACNSLLMPSAIAAGEKLYQEHEDAGTDERDEDATTKAECA